MKNLINFFFNYVNKVRRVNKDRGHVFFYFTFYLFIQSFLISVLFSVKDLFSKSSTLVFAYWATFNPGSFLWDECQKAKQIRTLVHHPSKEKGIVRPRRITFWFRFPVSKTLAQLLHLWTASLFGSFRLWYEVWCISGRDSKWKSSGFLALRWFFLSKCLFSSFAQLAFC